MEECVVKDVRLMELAQDRVQCWFLVLRVFKITVLLLGLVYSIVWMD